MNLSTRLDRVIAAVLAAGCTGLGTKDGTELDDVACLNVEVGADCPDEATASGELMGDTTCQIPVREVIATGAFVSSEDVVYTGYGGWDPPGDSGVPDTAAVLTRCCYEAAYEVHEGEDCVIGRPVLVDGAPLTAPTVARAGWGGGDVGEGPLDEVAAAYWARQGALEHASVAAFGRLVLDLLRLGAPASLVDRAGGGAARRGPPRGGLLRAGGAVRRVAGGSGPAPRARWPVPHLARAARDRGVARGLPRRDGLRRRRRRPARGGDRRARARGGWPASSPTRRGTPRCRGTSWRGRSRPAASGSAGRWPASGPGSASPDDVGSERAAAHGVPERDRVTHALALVEREVVGPARAALLAA
jgi:hypothetical protein